MTFLLASVLLSYLCGSFPTSLVVGRVTRGVDVREFGSGNAGATNALRVLGWRWALLVMAVDVFKGWFPAAVISRATHGLQTDADAAHDPLLLAILCGSAAILGHVYPLFAQFRGGKGVGTLVGVLLYLSPSSLAIGAVVFLLTVALTGYVGLASILSVSLFPLLVYLKFGTLNSWLGYFSMSAASFVIFKHRGNVARMRAGTENRMQGLRLFRNHQK